MALSVEAVLKEKPIPKQGKYNIEEVRKFVNKFEKDFSIQFIATVLQVDTHRLVFFLNKDKKQ